MKTKTLLLCLALLLLLSGCGTPKTNVDTVQEGVVSDSEPIVSYEYTAQQLTLQSGEDTFKAIGNAGDADHHVLCESYQGGYFVIAADQAGNLTEAVSLQVAEGLEPMALAVGQDSSFVVASYQVIEASAEKLDSLLSVDRYRTDGAWAETLYTIEDVYCPLFLQGWKDGYLLGINQEPSFQVSRTADRLLWLKDGQITECAFAGDLVTGALSNKTVILLCVGTRYPSQDGQTSDIGYDLCRYDPETQTTEPLMSPPGKVDLLAVWDNVAYGQCDGTLCAIELTTGTEERITGLLELGVSLSQTVTGGWTDGSQFVLLTAVGRFLRVAEEEVPTARETVTLGYVDSLGLSTEAVAQFNLTNPSYRIELLKYDNEGVLGMALATGEGPDMIETSLVPVRSYQEKGVLADLYPLMDADDTVRREDYVSSVLVLAENDGKLCTIPVQYCLWGMLVREDYLAEHPTVTLDDLLALPQEELSLSEPLRTLVEANLDLFYGGDAQSELVKILTLSKQAQETQMLSQRPSVMLPYGWYSPSQELDRTRLQQDYVPAGWPGLSSQGLAVYPLTELAINAKAACPQGAWTVLKYMISVEGQEAMGTSALPVNRSLMEMQIQETQQAGLSEAQTAKFLVMVNQAAAIVRQDSTILAICQEEAQAFYIGDKSAEDCAAIIVNRVKTYVGE